MTEGKRRGESSASSFQQVPSVVNPNTRITRSTFGMAIGGSSERLGYISGCIKEPKKEDPKYPNWVFENMLVVNWILNSMEESSAGSFRYCDTTKGLWDSIEASYV